MAATHPKIRVLHVIGSMTRGGIETWLMNILRRMDREQFQIDFMVHTDQRAAYDDEVRALGSKVIPCMHPSKPLKYAKNFKRVLRENGPYDVIHSHVHHFSGFILKLARQEGIPTRIIHSHSDTSSTQARSSLPRRLYFHLMTDMFNHHATMGLAVSENAARDLYGKHWKSDTRWKIFFCGIDCQKFQVETDPSTLRRELGIPEKAFVVGHIGRFCPVKNHSFFLKVAREISKRDNNARFLLVGDGPLRPEIEQLATELGLADRVIFTGLRPDVPMLMLGAMDALLFPSHYEGLPLVLLEAQAAGLPCVFSKAIAEETVVIPSLMHSCSLSESAEVWAEKVISAWKNNRLTQPEALSMLEKSPFNILNSISELENIYRSGMNTTGSTG